MPERMSGDAQRAFVLLKGGAIGGHAAMMIAVGAFWLVQGANAGISALAASVCTVVFFTLGQAVQIMIANDDTVKILIYSMISYVARVAFMGAMLAVVFANADSFAWMDRSAFLWGALATVFGWLGMEIWTFAHLRIPIYDPPK